MAATPRGAVPAEKPRKATKRRSVSGKSKKSAALPGKPEVRIFVSYSHHDAAAQVKLNTHLAPWRRDSVTVWYDENIEPGSGLDTEIARELRSAHIFIALFSPAYIDSHYCWEIEYKRAMARRARKQMRVVAVVIKPCVWKHTRAANFKLLPKDGIPPEGWSSSDAAYVNVAEGVGEMIKAVRRELAMTSALTARNPSKQKPAPSKAKPSRSGTVKATSLSKAGRSGSRGRKPPS